MVLTVDMGNCSFYSCFERGKLWLLLLFLFSASLFVDWLAPNVSLRLVPAFIGVQPVAEVRVALVAFASQDDDFNPLARLLLVLARRKIPFEEDFARHFPSDRRENPPRCIPYSIDSLPITLS